MHTQSNSLPIGPNHPTNTASLKVWTAGISLYCRWSNISKTKPPSINTQRTMITTQGNLLKSSTQIARTTILHGVMPVTTSLYACQGMIAPTYINIACAGQTSPQFKDWCMLTAFKSKSMISWKPASSATRRCLSSLNGSFGSDIWTPNRHQAWPRKRVPGNKTA